MNPLVLAVVVWVWAAAVGLLAAILLALRGTMAKPLPPAPMRDIQIMTHRTVEGVARAMAPMVTAFADLSRSSRRTADAMVAAAAHVRDRGVV